MSRRVWHELRVRERVGPNEWVKKSKFYEVKGPSEAVEIYEKHCRVEHTIMWCGKDRRHDPDRFVDQCGQLFRSLKQERVQGRTAFGELRDFLSLGDGLLKELRRGGGGARQVVRRDGSKNKRGYHVHKEAAD